MKPTTAVLMMAYGGPDSLDDVEPYLLDVRGGRPTSPELIEEIRGRYAAIGGKSPLLEITTRQAQALEQALNGFGSERNYQVYVGMRHWHPYIRETVAQIAADGLTDLVAICMTPFSSRMSTGAYFEQLSRAIEAQTEPAWREALTVRKIGAWFSHPTYIQAIAANLQAALADFRSSDGTPPVVLFSAHSLPVVAIEQGDPYADQFEKLACLVAEEAGLPDGHWQTCFQSAGAQQRIPWLGPAIEDTIQRLSTDGVKNILSAPIGFLSDHVEVLYDIDLEAQHVAQQCGITLRRIASLNDQPLFIQALREIIAE